jgi:hypothetical protein
VLVSSRALCVYIYLSRLVTTHIILCADAKATNTLDKLSVHLLRSQLPVFNASDVEEALKKESGDSPVSQEIDLSGLDELDSNGEDSDAEEENDSFEDVDKPTVLYPRAQRAFYKSLLKGMRMWRRPPDEYCARCALYTKNKAKIVELTGVTEAGDARPEVWQKLRELRAKMADLRKHHKWRKQQRLYVKHRERNLKPEELMLLLDYGGLTDSANRKVNVWSATALAKDREQENYDFFFDSANQTQKDDQQGAKKNGQSGIFFLGEMTDPGRDPNRGKVALIRHSYPNAKHIILSGDTGNGYRAYEMLEYLSGLFEQFGFTVELIPLPPGHAYNRTDARIAHMNTFLRKLKRRSRVFGAKEVARAFHLAADPHMATKRKFMARSIVSFRVVPQNVNAKEDKRNLGAMLIHPDLDKGQMGVRGFLYFDFSFPEVPGGATHPPGYARVREHGDPTMIGNPTRVFTWRKDLAKLMCQTCSDRAGYPVSQTVSGCTKKICAKAAQTVGDTLARARLPLALANAAPPAVSLDAAHGVVSVAGCPPKKRKKPARGAVPVVGEAAKKRKEPSQKVIKKNKRGAVPVVGEAAKKRKKPARSAVPVVGEAAKKQNNGLSHTDQAEVPADVQVLQMDSKHGDADDRVLVPTPKLIINRSTFAVAANNILSTGGPRNRHMSPCAISAAASQAREKIRKEQNK